MPLGAYNFCHTVDFLSLRKKVKNMPTITLTMENFESIIIERKYIKEFAIAKDWLNGDEGCGLEDFKIKVWLIIRLEKFRNECPGAYNRILKYRDITYVDICELGNVMSSEAVAWVDEPGNEFENKLQKTEIDEVKDLLYITIG